MDIGQGWVNRRRRRPFNIKGLRRERRHFGWQLFPRGNLGEKEKKMKKMRAMQQQIIATQQMQQPTWKDDTFGQSKNVSLEERIFFRPNVIGLQWCLVCLAVNVRDAF